MIFITGGTMDEDGPLDEFEESQDMCNIPVEATYTFGSDGEYDIG